MKVELHRRSQELFLSALELYGAERTSFLDRECSDAPELLETVERMLRFDADAPDFLARSPFSAAGAPEAHRTIGTIETGTVRFGIGWSNTAADDGRLVEALGVILQ